MTNMMYACLSLVVVSVCVQTLAAAPIQDKETETMVPVAYRCGKDCEEDMGGMTKRADTPNDTVDDKVDVNARTLAMSMNDNAPPVSQPPNYHRYFPDQGLKESQQIPYVSPGHMPAMRRPCHLDAVLDKCRAITDGYHVEATQDAMFTTSEDFQLRMDAAKDAHTDATDRVAILHHAKEVQTQIYEHLATCKSNAIVLKDKMNAQADLMEVEVRTKAPILQELGRINVELKQIMATKAAALAEFSKPPIPSEATKTSKIVKYNALINILKTQISLEHKGAKDLLSPIHMEQNQTDIEVSRLNDETSAIMHKVADLLQTAQAYSAAALSGALAIEADASAHYKAMAAAHQEYERGLLQRQLDRSTNDARLTSIVDLVTDIQIPRDLEDEFVYVNNTEPAMDDSLSPKEASSTSA